MENQKQKSIEEILEQIAKLKTLEKRPGTAHEAAAATAAINRLMLKYNLTMMEVNEHLMRDKSAYYFDDIILGVFGQHVRWRVDLYWHLCETNFCKCYYQQSGSAQAPPMMRVFGLKHNISIVNALYVYLVEQIARLCAESWDAEKIYSSLHKLKFTASFLDGAVEVVGQRLREEFRRARKELGTNALALLDTEVEKHWEAATKNMRLTGLEKTYSNKEAKTLGREAGHKVTLKPHIER